MKSRMCFVLFCAQLAICRVATAQTPDMALNDVNGMIAKLREEQAATQKSIQLLNDGSIIMAPIALESRDGKLITMNEFFDSPDLASQVFGAAPGDHPKWAKSLTPHYIPISRDQFTAYVTNMAIMRWIEMPESVQQDEKRLRKFLEGTARIVEDTIKRSTIPRRAAIAKLELRQKRIGSALLVLMKRRDALADEIKRGTPAVNSGPINPAWSRVWSTSWGDMTMLVSGGSMTGTFTHKDGKLEGTVSNNGTKIVGKWNQAPTRKAPNDAGAFEFSLDAGNKKFTGRWWYGFDTSKPADGGWTGTAK